MSAVVRSRPVVPQISRILDGAPVAASELLDMAQLLNHVLGMGAQVVPLFCPAQSITAAATVTFRFRVVPRYQSIQRVWVAGVRSTHASAAGGVELAAPTGGSLTAHPGRAAVARGSVAPIVYVENLSSQAAAEAEISLDVKATDQALIVETLGCWEMPRSSLSIGGSELGQDLERLRSGSPILAGTAGQSIGGLAAAMASARTTARRGGLIQWAVNAAAADAKAFTSASYTDLWLLPQPILARKLYASSTIGTVTSRIYAWTDAATTSANVRWNTTSGGAGVASLSIPAAAGSTTPQWWPATAGAAKTFSVDCEDLTVADGRRSARWDDVQLQVKRTSVAGTIYVSAVSVFEA